MLFNTKDVFIVASTGCMETELDSMESIMAGSDAGATGYVLPLDMTADGIAVLCANGSYPLPDGSRISVNDTSFREIRAVHQKVVTVGQCVELVKSCAGKLCVDMKAVAACAQIKLALTHADYLEYTYFAGLSLNEAIRLAKLHPALHFMFDVPSLPIDSTALIRSAQSAGVFGLRVAPAALTRDLVSEVHRVGMFVASTESHDDAVLDAMITMGVNFIETLRPDVAYSLLPQPEDSNQVTL